MTKLFLSFWHVQLENFPEGAVSRRSLKSAEARELILQAQSEGVFQGACADDLFAPYKETEKRKHDELRQVLQDDYDIPLSVSDFSTKGEDYVTVYPLNFVTVSNGSSLMVVTCGYTFSDFDEIETLDDTNMFSIAADSVNFCLFEAIPVQH
ncbi:hypothetical protein EUZ85_02285 [Hahella sp. KA22]|uniref:hypothetical protein n=1 Tax=Hahella sp. KA22 TaxID=1628392 RepID=UPI000FDE6DCB|nr:hypothetical protein [Hahella sp. KA22]AZZ95322.1 hypothetical protein ENC22_30575 [Hahella sp. KA22]QAY52967.1 hypothetical protein EUZ85_02285 [Hahella sp. KA22]